MLLQLILAASFFSIAVLISLFHRDGFLPGIHNLIFVVPGLFCSWRFVTGVFLFNKLTANGWDIPFHKFAWKYEETGLGHGDTIPPKQDFKTTPFYSDDQTEWQNLREALLLAKGWDVETRSWRDYVPLYTPSVVGMEEFISDMLKDHDFLVIVSGISAAEGAYAARNLSPRTIYVPVAQFDESRAFLADYFAENENEMKGLASPRNTGD